MSIAPLITFKAGRCDVEGEAGSNPLKVKPVAQPGYIYLYADETELIHFCWRARDVPLDNPHTDLIMVPADGHFVPYETNNPSKASAKTNGRIFALKFSSSSERHFFWLQSKPQALSGNPAWMSPRDLKLGDMVERILQGEEVDVTRELAAIRNNHDDSGPNGGNDAMEGVEGPGGEGGQGGQGGQGGTGGAGADATGGDVRTEGEDAREGGADGARA